MAALARKAASRPRSTRKSTPMSEPRLAPQPQPPTSWRQAILATLTLVVIVVCVWSPVLHFGFIYDDHLQIVSNPDIQSISHVGSLLTEPLWSQLGPSKASSYFRPLFSLSLMGQYLLFGPNPVLWHLASLALHVLVVLSLFGFLLLFFHRVIPAVIGAALFGLSPGTAEVVGWVSASNESLYTLLILLSLCAISLWFRATNASYRRLLRVTVLLLLSLALFAKETAIVGIPIAIAYERFLGGRKHSKPMLSYLVLVIPLFALAIGHLRSRMADAVPPAQVLTTMPFITTFAIKKLVWPMPVAAFYDLWFDQKHSMFLIVTAGFAAILLSLAMVRCFLRPYRFAAWASLVVFLPVIVWMLSVRLLGDYAVLHDRYLYLAYSGEAMLVAYVMTLGNRRLTFSIVAASLLIVVVELTQVRPVIQQYRDDISFFSHAVAVAPKNLMAIQLLGEAELHQGNCAAAQQTYVYAEQVRPDLWRSPFYLGIAYMHCGMAAPASDAFSRATTSNGATTEEHALAWYELARARLIQRDVKGAQDALTQAALRDPGSKRIQSLINQAQTMEKVHAAD
jgi:hypothetical protein